MILYRRTVAPLSRLAALAMFTAALALAACPKEQAATSDSGEQQAEETDNSYRGDTAAFVKNLYKLKVYSFTVTDAGAAVVYEELSFLPDGRFEAATSIRVGEEPFACREAGNWAMDDDRADDRSTSALTLEITETDCAGRSAPDSFRIRARINGQEIELSHI